VLSDEDVTESDALIAMDEVQRHVRELPTVARSLVEGAGHHQRWGARKAARALDALGLLRRRPRGCLDQKKIGSTEGGMRDSMVPKSFDVHRTNAKMLRGAKESTRRWRSMIFS
jgi:hypothetical protein